MYAQIPEYSRDFFLEVCYSRINAMINAVSCSQFKFARQNICQNDFSTQICGKLSDKIADDASPHYNNTISWLYIALSDSIDSNGQRLNKRSQFGTHPDRHFNSVPGGDHGILLKDAFTADSKMPQRLADVVSFLLAGETFPASQLRLNCNQVPLHYCTDLVAFFNNNSTTLMSLHQWVGHIAMQSVINLNIGCANTGSDHLDEDLMIFNMGSLGISVFDFSWCSNDRLKHVFTSI